ncbi:hypothetical protein [Acaryochloris marina]|uniref:hypothetical protein n=1 Tax=Acaryochloris marina TaxID=155978 RepID=UPI0021C49CA0|nr:hypothetical protein [Acaryochloris marina]BDM78784.1 hypothetical protein AM10699_16530 [Acaryochloris marina MBIC10699]
MSLLHRPYFWFFSFTILFLLSLDFWRWDQGISLSLFQLPSWLFYFVILQGGLVLAIAGVSSTLWHKTERDQ